MTDTRDPSVVRRWTILGCSLLAALTATCVVSGVAYLIPALHNDSGMSLTTAAALAAVPNIGLMTSTVGWGILLDRYGERRILLISLTIALAGAVGAAVTAAVSSNHLLLAAALLVGGLGAGAANGASGRIVIGWFPADQRGTAMGVRQMAQPLGIAACALTMPVVAAQHGAAAALAIPAVITGAGLVAVVVGITDPPRGPRVPHAHRPVANPYRGDRFLLRVHVVSMLLVIPQSMLWTFIPTWLIVDRQWSPAAAGVLITVAQVTGALGRIAAGRWSDMWGSRVQPIRVIAVAAAVAMGVLAFADAIGTALAPAVMVVATVISVADNGLAFTAIAEFAGPEWSGRGLAIQNTGQYLVTAVTAPVIGAVIAGVGFSVAFAATALAPVLAVPLVPRDAREARDVRDRCEPLPEVEPRSRAGS